MSFADMCLEAYKKLQKESKEVSEKMAEEFRKIAVREFEKRFNVSVTSSRPINEYEAELTFDDIKLVARDSGTNVQFFTMLRCKNCGAWFLPDYPDICITLADIGRELSNPRMCGRCRSILNPPKTRSSGEQVIEKLREILDIVGYHLEEV